ncbi:MAG: trk/ktr system potassium uptake protein [Clostridiales bacterium]|nr:trk/ktr system potassium uptake protein [Clostridiales bacterium]MDK2933489.1 trk/ktr system potassium uptake protein [Clostridiales bacterium]
MFDWLCDKEVVYILNIVKKKKILNHLLNIHPTQAIVLGFATIILIGAVLLNLPIASKDGQSIGFLNALFTATSAVCVTGLVVVDTYTHWTVFGQIIILTLIQIGGLGFMTMATLLSFVLRRRITLKERLLIVESLNQYNIQGVVKLIQRILIGTLIFEGAGAIILSLRFIPDFGVVNGTYKGIFHAISAFCNAGFDLMGEYQQFSSLTMYVDDLIVNLVVMSLIVIGGLGFAVWDDVYRAKNFRGLQLHTKLVLSITGALLVFGFIFFFLMEFNNPATLKPLNIKGKVLASMFQSVTIRTAGFNTINQPDMTNASVFVTMFLMFIGGSPGSTAGGIKTATVGVLIFTVLAVIKGKEDIELFERRINHSIALRALAITAISVVLVVTVTVILSIFKDATLVEVLFEAISAFGTVGLSLGITPSLSDISKLALIITMFLGRVGVLTMALALASRTHKAHSKYRYLEDKVMVG